MIPDIHILTAERLARRGEQASSGLPQVTIVQRTNTLLPFVFLDAAGAVITVTSARCVIKAAPTAAAMLLDSSLDLEGTGDDAYYKAVWATDAADSDTMRAFLLASIGTNNQAQAWCEVEWILDGKTDRVSFPINLQAAFFLPGDTAPDPAADEALAWLRARAVLHNEAQSLAASAITQALANLGMRITAGGYVEFTANDGSKFHVGLNSGAAPE